MKKYFLWFLLTISILTNLYPKSSNTKKPDKINKPGEYI